MDNYKHKVDWCETCDQGWIEIKRNSVSDNIHFRCSECLIEYEKYEDINTDRVLKMEEDWHVLDLSVEEILQHNKANSSKPTNADFRVLTRSIIFRMNTSK